MATFIHPTSIIEQGASLGENVHIGPFCTVGAHVSLGDGVVLKSHISIDGHTKIGAATEIFPFAAIGHAPQDKKYHGESSELIIGSHNVIREYTTMNPGTEGGGMLTTVGDYCLFMASTHVAHDCKVGNHVILANNATLAGHVEVGDYAIIGGLSAVHQFVRIGHHAMIGGMSGIEADVIPYGITMGERAGLAGLNLIGLKRQGLEKSIIHMLRHAYQEIFEPAIPAPISERIIAAAEKFKNEPSVMEIIRFLQADSSRAICKPRNYDAS